MGSHIFIDASAQPKQEFLAKLKKNYNSDMEKVNFRDSATAVKKINNWASNVTEGHIQQLVSEGQHILTILFSTYTNSRLASLFIWKTYYFRLTIAQWFLSRSQGFRAHGLGSRVIHIHNMIYISLLSIITT